MLWCAAEIDLQDRIWSCTDAPLVAHTKQRRKGGCNYPRRRKTHLVKKSTHEKHRSGVKVMHRELSEPKVTHLSNSCLMTRKQSAMGRAARRSWYLGNTFPSWSFKSAQPWPSGNQIQSAHSRSLSPDNILTAEGADGRGFVDVLTGREKSKREVFNRFIFKLIQGQTKEMNAYWLEVINLSSATHGHFLFHIKGGGWWMEDIIMQYTHKKKRLVRVGWGCSERAGGGGCQRLICFTPEEDKNKKQIIFQIIFLPDCEQFLLFQCLYQNKRPQYLHYNNFTTAFPSFSAVQPDKVIKGRYLTTKQDLI